MSDEHQDWPMTRSETQQDIYDKAYPIGYELVTEWGKRPFVSEGIQAVWTYRGFEERECDYRVIALATWQRNGKVVSMAKNGLRFHSVP